jgi:iron(III) transport system substrate-binding protein
MRRREFLRGALLAGTALLSTACSQPAAPLPTGAPARPTEAPDPAAPAGPDSFSPSAELAAAAERDGRVVVYHGGPAGSVARIMGAFKARFPWLDVGDTLVQREAQLMSRILAESRAGQHQADVFYSDLEVLLIDLQKRGLLMRYASPEYRHYDPKFLSQPPEYYAGAFLTLIGIAYNTAAIKEADAPRSWRDLLDPKYRGKISVFDSSASSPFAAWQLLPAVAGQDYWEQISQQDLRTYASSDQLLDALASGETPITMQFDNSGLKRIADRGLPIKAVWPTEGVPTFVSVQGILARAPHPNAARLFHDWFLSRDGMNVSAHPISSQLSARPDVSQAPTNPDHTRLNLLASTDRDAYGEAYAEFKPAWDRIVGLK